MPRPTTTPTTGRPPKPRRPTPPPPARTLRPPASRRALCGLLAALGLVWLGAPAAQAQIVREKPGQIKAANRRALREASRTDGPYKDSHLAVTPARLKRGASAQPLPEGSDELHYKNGPAPNVKPPGVLGALGLRRKRKL